MQHEEMAKYHETLPTQRMASSRFIKIYSYTNHDSYNDQKPSKFMAVYIQNLSDTM